MSESEMSQSAPAERGGKASRRKRAVFLLVGLFVVYVLIGYLVLPSVVERELVVAIEAQTGVTPQVGAIPFDPFGERLAVEGFALPDPRGEEPAVAFEELSVNIAFARLFRARLGLEEIGLVGLRVSARAREAMSSALSARNHPSPDGRACDRDASRLGRRKFLPVA